MIDDEELWQFCLNYYAKLGVEGFCLNLQDQAQLDVCVYLLCAFMDKQGLSIHNDEIEHLLTATESWRQMLLMPLRVLRERQKFPGLFQSEAAEMIRQALKGIELDAEKLQLSEMAKCLNERKQIEIVGQNQNPGIEQSVVYRYFALQIDKMRAQTYWQEHRRLSVASKRS